MSQPFRLNKEGLINRNKKISFTFNGKKLFGYDDATKKQLTGLEFIDPAKGKIFS